MALAGPFRVAPGHFCEEACPQMAKPTRDAEMRTIRCLGEPIRRRLSHSDLPGSDHPHPFQYWMLVAPNGVEPLREVNPGGF